MATDKRSAGRHRHECPLCRAAVQCVDPLPHCSAWRPHRVGHPPEIEVKLFIEEWEQRYKLCKECARRESKGMKGTVGGDVAILAQLLESAWPPRNPVDVLAEALLARERPMLGTARENLTREFDRTKAALDQMLGSLYGRTKKEARQLAVFAYLEAPQEERDVARKVMRQYPKAGFPSRRAFAQAAYRLRKKLVR